MGSVFYGWDMWVNSRLRVTSKMLTQRLYRGLIGGVISLPSFKQYFGIDKMSASAVADLNGNIVAILQAGSL
jgi:hypothetical protein